MNLINLIPAAEEISAPVNLIVGDETSGLAGLANLIQSQDLAGAASGLSGVFQSAITQAIPSAEGSPFGGTLSVLQDLSTATELPTDLLTGINQPLQDLQQIVERIPQIITTLSATGEAINDARNGDLTPVVQQATTALNDVVRSLTGPDLAGFSAWRDYLFELADTIRPITESGASAETIRDQLLLLAFGRVRDAIFALAPSMNDLSSDADAFFANLLPDVNALNLETLQNAVLAKLAEIKTAADTGVGDIETLTAEYRAAVIQLTDQINAAFDSLQAHLDNPLLQINGVANIAQRELDSVLAMRIDDYSNVPQRLDEFFTGVEESVDAVDLSLINNTISDFFTQIQEAITSLDTDAIQREISNANTTAENTVAQAQQMLTALTAQIQGWLNALTGSLDSAITQLGETGEDGKFHFFFEAELNALYAKIDTLIQGDPNHPENFSIQGSLTDFSNTFVDLIQTIEQQLLQLAAQLDASKDALATTLDGVKTEIEAVDPQAVMDQATASIEQAFQAIGNLEFEPVVDPIIAELDEARDALADIDLSSLNDLLKAALKAALDAIQTSDFDREITAALLKELDEKLVEPREFLQSIADKINQLLNRVIAISPESLFAPVQQELDKIVAALDVDIAQQLRPIIDKALAELTGELEALNPAQFLTPLHDLYNTLQQSVDKLQPAQLLQPVQQQIDQLAQQVASIDLDAMLTPVNSVFGNVNTFLDALDPQRLLQPINEPFDSALGSLQAFAPSTLLAPLTDIMAQIADLTENIPESVINQIRDLYDEALTRANTLNPTVLFDAVREPYSAFKSRFESLQPNAALHAIQQEFSRTQTAVVQADTRDGSSFALELELSVPTILFASVSARCQQYQTRFNAVLNGLDPTNLEQKYQQAQARIDELLPLAIRDDITAGRLETLLGLTNPAVWIERLDAIYDRTLNKLNQLSPAVLFAPLNDTYQTLRSALSAFDIAPVIAMIENIIQKLSELIGSISLEAIFAPLLAMVERMKNLVTGLDPSLLIDGLNDRYQNLIGVLDNVAVDSILTALQSAWDGLQQKIAALFNLENLLQPLLEIFAAIRAILSGLDAGELTGVLDDKLTKMRDELEQALNRTGTAFKQMLAAVPLEGASGSASAAGSIG